MAQKQSRLQRKFDEIRNKYPQHLIELSMKEELLKQCIEKLYMTEFEIIQRKWNKSRNKPKIQNNQKVIDYQRQQSLGNQTNQLPINQINQAIKIIVKAYQKNTQICKIYSYIHVQQMVQKTKITFKDLIETYSQKQREKHNIGQKHAQPTTTITNRNTQLIENNQQVTNENQQQLISNKSQKNQRINIKPKSNSLFVPKQTPISQKNIFNNHFKAQHNHQSTPTSTILNNNPQKNLIIPQKPKSKSSNKSNASSKNKVTSKESSQNVPVVYNAIQKKSQQLNETTDHNKITQKQNQIQLNNQTEDPELNSNQKAHATSQHSSQEHIEQVEQTAYKEQQQQREQQQVKHNNKEVTETKNGQKKIIVLSQKSNQLHLPSFKLSIERPVVHKKNPIDSILTNPFIKKTFSHICKQSYIGGGKTFDQIAQSADIMNLNKWMVFCKEFDFLSKLKKKQLVDIFQQTTSSMPRMNQQQFLDALIIIQNKLRVDEQDFIHKNMCLDSEFAFRQKVASFKVSYTGPKQNFFEQATIKPLDKYYKNLREAKYQQEKKKQKQILLCQGKFKQQIENELLDRKNQRELKRNHLVNSIVINKDSKITNAKRILSGSVDVIQKDMQNQSIKSPYLNYLENKANNSRKNQTSFNRYEQELKSSKLQISRRMDPITYSEIFTQKNSTSTRAFTTENKNSNLRLEDSKTKATNNLQKNQQHTQRSISHLSKINFKKESEEMNQIKTHQTTQKKHQKAQQIKPERQWLQQVKDWNQEFDNSSSEESDEILKEHLKGEKLRKNDLPQKMQLSRMIQHLKHDQKWLQPNEQQDFHSQWDRVTELQTTNKKQRFK